MYPGLKLCCHSFPVAFCAAGALGGFIRSTDCDLSLGWSRFAVPVGLPKRFLVTVSTSFSGDPKFYGRVSL